MPGGWIVIANNYLCQKKDVDPETYTQGPQCEDRWFKGAI